MCVERDKLERPRMMWGICHPDVWENAGFPEIIEEMESSYKKALRTQKSGGMSVWPARGADAAWCAYAKSRRVRFVM